MYRGLRLLQHSAWRAADAIVVKKAARFRAAWLSRLVDGPSVAAAEIAATHRESCFLRLEGFRTSWRQANLFQDRFGPP